MEKPAPWLEQPQSLREFCRQLAESGGTKIHIAYDYFFGGSGRGIYPDTPEFIDSLKKIHDVAREYGLGIEPSVLSPLELGVGYRAKTGESGRWMQYGEGLRDPQTGRYAVQLWKHTQWVNNKGPMPVRLSGVRVFAFREKPCRRDALLRRGARRDARAARAAAGRISGQRPGGLRCARGGE